MINEIQINKFRGIKTGKIKGFRRINVIVGPNNAGKSAIIEALYLANTAQRQAGLIVQKQNREVETYQVGVSTKDFLGNDPLAKVLTKHGYTGKATQTNRIDHGAVKVHAKDKHSPLANFDLDAGQEDGFTDEDLNVSIFAMNGASVLDEEKQALVKNIGDSTKASDNDLEHGDFSQQIQTLRSLADQLEDELEDLEDELEGSQENETRKRALSKKVDEHRETARLLEGYRNFVEKLTGQTVTSWENQRVVYCWHPSLTFFSEGTAHWTVSGQPGVGGHTLLYDMDAAGRYMSPEFYKRVLENVPGWTQRIAQYFGPIFDLDPASFNALFGPTLDNGSQIQGWIASKDRPALPIDAYGDGARTAFKLLAYLVPLAEMATPESPGLVLWEEPESFQNPVALGRLFNQVMDIIRDKPIQLFCATHSLEVVAHLTRMLQNDDVAPDDAILFQVNLEGGELISTWFYRNNLVGWLESGMDPRVWDEFNAPVQFSFREEAR